MILKKISKKNKKGQEFGLASIFILGILLMILAPVVIKVILSTTEGLTTGLNNTSPEAVAEGQGAVNKVLTWFDYLIIIGFFVALILLLISSYYIDTNPVFIILFIILAFVLVLVGDNMLDALDDVYGQFNETEDYLTFTNFLRDHYMGFMVGIMLLAGIIMYAKFKYGSEY